MSDFIWVLTRRESYFLFVGYIYLSSFKIIDYETIIIAWRIKVPEKGM